MKYIIMCGGPRSDSPLREMFGETLVERTIRLLKENGIEDIAISSNDGRYKKFGYPVLEHDNPLTWENFCWLKCYYPTDEPVCYIYGDVFFSPYAIEVIVRTETEDIEFFASAPPFNWQYTKHWAEPFAYKVQNTERFFECIEKAKELGRQGKFKRGPISWELWQVIKGTPLNRIDYHNYTAINDYTVDVDTDEQAAIIEARGIC